MFTVFFKSVSVVVLLTTMLMGTANERSVTDNIRSDIRISPIDGKAIPTQMNYQGYLMLMADSTPVNANLNMIFNLFTTESGGTAFWTETHNGVEVENGIFNVILGSTNSLDPNDFTGSPLWLQTTVGGEVLTPRKKIVSSAYSVRALYSDTAEYVINGTPDNDWAITGNVLYPAAQYGLAMYGNILFGSSNNTHVNLGVACTTGTSGQNNYYCTVGGGRQNTSSAWYATVGGGYQNTSSGYSATVGGGRVNNSSGDYATVGGGNLNTSSDSFTTIGGGRENTSSGIYATVGGGLNNTSSAWEATVGGGLNNTSSGYCATVGGGENNTSSSHYATVGGGYGNTSSGYSATVGGGLSNTSSGSYATVPGGFQVNVSGDHSFGFGQGLTSTSFDVADDHDVVFGDGGYVYQFGINRENPSYPLHIGTNSGNGNGAYLTTSGVWTNGCSRTFKENFTKPDAKKILELVKKLDIFRYNYKGDEGVYHISPVAEDFYELFKTGNDNRYLAGIDVSGVSLLAIKALAKENEEILMRVENNSDEIIELNARISNLTSENQELRSEIEQMRADIEMLKSLNN